MKSAAALGVAIAVVVFSLRIATHAAQKPANQECLACHGDSTLTKEVAGKPFSLYVSPAKFKNSIHGSMFSCVDCHADVKTAMHESTPAKASCSRCHAEEQAAYDRSLHGRAVQSGNSAAATCTDCHGSPHELLPASDPRSKVSHAKIPSTCGSCHGQKFVMEPSGLTTQPFLSYQESVHGRAVQAGVQKAAVCTDCHGSHEVMGASDSKSAIFKFNVPGTCGKCHAEVQQQFSASIHGQAVSRGDWQAPVCTDCHGIHAIKSRHDPNSSVSALNLAQSTCARCHESVRLSEEFGMENRRATTYLASYHGLASRLGSQVVANCASCHGAHNILPSSDPRSTINHANLIVTCGHCHPGVTERFVAAKVHVDGGFASDTGSVAMRWIRRFYITLIVVVIGGMLVHNFVIWRSAALAAYRRNRPQVLRMTVNQRWQHWVLLVSFIVLALTGFALKYPESGFAALLGMSERMRSIVHRVAGTVLIVAGIYHLFYLAFLREGRRMLSDMAPQREDGVAAWRNLRYHLGLNPVKPQFGRFSYAEKIEYWALIWGTIIMALTGIMLWAKIFVANLLPRWWLDAATAVHLYEAVLATLAILVWHLYQVFFDPHAFPMNWAWWDGRMDLDRFREAHALDPEQTPGDISPPGKEPNTNES
jgi:cytochrome b subunit of formate dehydrogenase